MKGSLDCRVTTCKQNHLCKDCLPIECYYIPDFPCIEFAGNPALKENLLKSEKRMARRGFTVSSRTLLEVSISINQKMMMTPSVTQAGFAVKITTAFSQR